MPPEFEPIPEPPQVTERAMQENRFFGANPHEKHPNSVYLPLPGRGFISWHSENGIAVLALFILALIALVAIVTVVAAMVASDKSWAQEFLKILGQAMLAVAGAVIGAGASSGSRRR